MNYTFQQHLWRMQPDNVREIPHIYIPPRSGSKLINLHLGGSFITTRRLIINNPHNLVVIGCRYEAKSNRVGIKPIRHE
ncbi:hypothetical protein LguiB_018324 [Lonicera macranthoides]